MFWGALHGGYLSVERMVSRSLPDGRLLGVAGAWAKRALATAHVFFWVCVAWVLFRAGSVENACAIFSKIASPEVLDLGAVTGKVQVAKAFLLIGVIVIGDVVWAMTDVERFVTRHAWLGGVFVGACGLLLAFAGTFYGNSFIYFQF